MPSRMTAPPQTANTNTFSMDYRVLTVSVTLIIVLAGGWINAVMRQGRADERIALLEAWKTEHTKASADLLAELRTSIKQTNDLVSATAAASTKQNAELQETLTTVRIQMAARH